MKKSLLIAIVFGGLISQGCQPTPPQKPLKFAKPPHVMDCLSGLYALDNLAQRYGGTQLGQRITEAPWLRKTRHTHALGQYVKLNRETLGVQLMPMLHTAQQSLAIEINEIPSHILNTWQQEFHQSSALSFMNYCSKEAASAQLQDSTATLNWLAQLTLEQPIKQSASVTSQKNHKIEQALSWKTYTPAPTQTQRISFSQDLIGQPLLGPPPIRALLDRYRPTWQVADAINSEPRAISYTDGTFKANNTLASYAYFNTGIWNKTFVLQLHYVIWLNNEKQQPSNNAFIFRINLNLDGRAIAYETVHLSGANYQVYLPKDYTLTTPFNGMFVNTIRSTPTMMVKIAGKPARIIEVSANSGTADTQHYQLLEFDSLYTLTDKTDTQSIFDKQGRLKTQSKNPLAHFLLGSSSIKKLGQIKNLGQQRINHEHNLYFDDPNLMTYYGLKKIQ